MAKLVLVPVLTIFLYYEIYVLTFQRGGRVELHSSGTEVTLNEESESDDDTHLQM